jgi:Phage integrase family
MRWNVVARNATELVTPPRKARHDFVPSPLIRHAASWRRSRETGWRRCTSSPSPLGCAKGSCSGFDGPTSTSPLARCTSSGSSRRDPYAGGSCSSASRWTRSGASSPGSAGTAPAWPRVDDHGLVFTNTVGKPPASLQLPAAEFLSPLLARARHPGIRLHDLRHSAATLLLGLGIQPKIVSEMLGHSQIGITLDLYSHVTATMQQEAVRAFEGLFGSQEERPNTRTQAHAPVAQWTEQRTSNP